MKISKFEIFAFAVALASLTTLACQALRPEQVTKVKEVQAEVTQVLVTQRSMAEEQLARATAEGNAAKMAAAEKNLKLVTRAQELSARGIETLNLVIQPDGTIDLTPLGPLANTLVPGGGLILALGTLAFREFRAYRQLEASKAATAEAKKISEGIVSALDSAKAMVPELESGFKKAGAIISAELAKTPNALEFVEENRV